MPLPALRPGPQHAYNELIEQLPSRAMLVANYAVKLHPSLVQITTAELEYANQLSAHLAIAISAIVGDYFGNRMLQKIVPLSPLVKDNLERLSSIPFDSGILRPDFLYDSQFLPRICEVNARFPFNACILSDFVQTTLAQQGVVRPAFKAEILRKFIATHVHGSVLILKERESGYDIHFVVRLNN